MHINQLKNAYSVYNRQTTRFIIIIMATLIWIAKKLQCYKLIDEMPIDRLIDLPKIEQGCTSTWKLEYLKKYFIVK